jgi:hypothetical protein
MTTSHQPSLEPDPESDLDPGHNRALQLVSATRAPTFYSLTLSSFLHLLEYLSTSHLRTNGAIKCSVAAGGDLDHPRRPRPRPPRHDVLPRMP